MIKPACGAGVNLGDLTGGQSSELSAGNKGPGVGSSKSCIGLASGVSIRDQGLGHGWTARWCEQPGWSWGGEEKEAAGCRQEAPP